MAGEFVFQDQLFVLTLILVSAAFLYTATMHACSLSKKGQSHPGVEGGHRVQQDLKYRNSQTWNTDLPPITHALHACNMRHSSSSGWTLSGIEMHLTWLDLWNDHGICEKDPRASWMMIVMSRCAPHKNVTIKYSKDQRCMHIHMHTSAHIHTHSLCLTQTCTISLPLSLSHTHTLSLTYTISL